MLYWVARHMDNKTLESLIWKKYIIPTQRPAQDYIGIEYELPLLNRKKAPVDHQLVHRLTDAFMEQFGFEASSFDDEGNICSALQKGTRDDLSFDCSYNTLEFSFGKERNLNILAERFRKYYLFVKDFLEQNGHTITGMGINPHWKYNRNVPVPNGRYRMLFHHLNSYKKYRDRMLFHDIPYFGLISCASQTHVDVAKNELLQSINTFNKLEPLKALLFANSPLDSRLCSRDYLWNSSLHGLNQHNVGEYEKPLATLAELSAYIRSMSLYCLERDGKYINFEPVPLQEYFSSANITGEYYNGRGYDTIDFAPRPEDLDYLRSYKFEDLTFRGTLELRSVCEQPVREIFAPAAFHAGLKKNLGELTYFLDHLPCIYEQGYTIRELRRLFVLRELPAFVDRKQASDALICILDIAAAGLKQRRCREEHFLEPLYRRARELNSPAKEMVAGLENGRTLDYFIEKFGEI